VARIEVIACDGCGAYGDDYAVTHYKVERADKVTELDLCAACSRPIEQATDKGHSKSARPAAKPARRRGGVVVVTPHPGPPGAG
jgi:hypothetical protein